MDLITKEHRSWNMSRIRGRNTGPEIAVRSMLHRMGFRFRLHARDLPGQPDLVLPRFRSVILVHGCFWHRHKNCPYAYTPKSRKKFWQTKFAANARRDRQVRAQLKTRRWKIITVWECELKHTDQLAARLEKQLRGSCNGVNSYK